MSDIVTRFEDASRSGWRSFSQRMTRFRTGINLSAALLLFVLVVSWQWIFVTVPAGHVAIRWWRMFGGTDPSYVYGEGAHFNFPWDEMPIYNVRIQQIGRDFDVLTSDGMLMTVNVVVRFRLNPATVGMLHKSVGPGYIDTLVMPAVGTYTRQVFSQYPAEDAYAAQRLAIQERIRKAVADNLAPRGVAEQTPVTPWLFVEDMLIRSMTFPPAVEAAINRKMEQYQANQEYAYRLERERRESERKQVEAEGIARFQQIVGAGISENYLRWKGIDATLSLAQSQNAKVVVIGTPRDGMPLILGNADAPGPVMAVPAAPTPQPQVAHDK